MSDTLCKRKMGAAGLTVAITRASGAILGRELLRALEAGERESLAIVACGQESAP